MPELYLRLLNRILTPILLLLAFYLLFRGHNLPGGLGLAVAICAGFTGLLEGTFFKGIWFSLDLPLLGDFKLGTPVVFDLGVFLVVASVTTSYLLGLSRVSDTAAQRRGDTASRFRYIVDGPEQANPGVAPGKRAGS